VVEPVGAMLNMEEPEEEAMTKGLTAAIPWTLKVFCMVVVPTFKMLDTVVVPVIAKVAAELFQVKLAEPAVVEAAV
jgi:hypothetical protein